MNLKEDLINCFNDTMYHINTDSKLLESTLRATENTKLYCPETAVYRNLGALRSGGLASAEISVISDTTFHAAQSLAKKYQRVAVLNFASAVHPGGGVTVGSAAQEECLCRSSNLLPCLNQPELMANYYMYHRNLQSEMYSDRLIYTKGVTVFKTDDDIPQLMPEEDWFKADVITCAAPNLIHQNDVNNAVLFDIFKKRIVSVFSAAIDNGAEAVVLGAWGCGAFKNPPQIVAKAFREVISENFSNDCIGEIVFAIKSTDKPSVNITEFQKVFGKPLYNSVNSDEAVVSDETNTFIKCPDCGRKNKGNSNFCLNCGHSLQGLQIVCEVPECENFEGETTVLIENVPYNSSKNRFNIINELYNNGSSKVYSAYDTQAARQCSLRIINRSDNYDMIKASVYNMTRFSHFAINTPYSISEDENNLYVACDLITGSSLDVAAEMCHFNLQEEQVVHWAKQICSVLSYLHSFNPPYIFCDVKPSNFIVTSENQIKVTNFDALTQGFSKGYGTVGFAAPEVFNQGGYIDGRADIYSLGVTIYYLLTGSDVTKPPYRYDNIRNYRADVSKKLESVVNKCIQVNPSLRYQNCVELSADLEKCIKKGLFK